MKYIHLLKKKQNSNNRFKPDVDSDLRRSKAGDLFLIVLFLVSVPVLAAPLNHIVITQ